MFRPALGAAARRTSDGYDLGQQDTAHLNARRWIPDELGSNIQFTLARTRGTTPPSVAAIIARTFIAQSCSAGAIRSGAGVSRSGRLPARAESPLLRRDR